MRKGIAVIDVCYRYINYTSISPDSLAEFFTELNLFLEEQAQQGAIIGFVYDEVGDIYTLDRITEKHWGLRAEQEAQRLMAFAAEYNTHFLKGTWDAFESSNIRNFFCNLSAEEVYLCGMFSAMCVFSSAKGAKKLGFKTNVMKHLSITECGRVGIPSSIEEKLQQMEIIGYSG